MRSDYGLYSIAVICFILAAAFAASLVPGYTLSETQGVTVTVVFLLIGIIAAAVGYSARPKATMHTAEPMHMPTPVVPIEESVRAAEEPTEPVFPPPPAAPVEEVQAAPEPTPEPAEPSELSMPTVVTSEVEAVQTQPTPTETPAEATTEKPKPRRRRRKKAAA